MTFRCGNIALAGRPNAGKSTFLNEVLGEKVSIVSDKPQTTRNRILGVYNGENCQIGFLDLPGIHKPEHRMNRLMMRTVHLGLSDADLIFHFIDATCAIGSGDRFVRDFLKEQKLPVIMVVNKIDLVNKSKLIPKLTEIEETFTPDELIPISAKTGDNLQKLLEIGCKYLEEGEAIYPVETLTNQTVRFMAQEAIREKILHYTHQEIPHATAVNLERFEETEDEVFIGAVIWVDRANQRKIILGKQGQMISKIRQGARRGLKQMLDKKVTLELYVKVQEQWRDQEKILKDLDLG